MDAVKVLVVQRGTQGTCTCISKECGTRTLVQVGRTIERGVVEDSVLVR